MDHNDRPNQGFMTISTGDIAKGIGNYPLLGKVSGYILLNHVVVCMNSFGKSLSGTQAQQNLVQRVMSLLPVQFNPCLWLEIGLFPPIILVKSAQDDIAPL